MQRTLQVNAKLLPFLTKPQPIKVVVGGRGSGKSIGLADLATLKMESERIDIYCLREFQESIADSVHRTLSMSITDRLQLTGWDIQETKIVSPYGNRTMYKGAARNVNSIQGAENYLLSIFSEAHTASQASLDKLLPTILRKTGAQCWFDANPQHSSDPFSQRFIVPYLDVLERDGVYEDELHYIVVVNWRDNPWWNEEQELLRSWDYENLSRSKYDWIWEGKFNDEVENALIMPEWFDACIDAHIKLGFAPRGAEIVAHDPSDSSDPRGLAHRHGSVLVEATEKTDGDVNDGCDWATGYATSVHADDFVWDEDGLGKSLRRQINDSLTGKRISLYAFSGGAAVENPAAIYEPISGEKSKPRTNKDQFYNRRAQRYWELRDRIYLTYRAVAHNEYCDPERMLSLSSGIKSLSKLRSELCRIPLKDNKNGMIQILSKPEMKKLGIPSPNIADCVMMTMEGGKPPKKIVNIKFDGAF